MTELGLILGINIAGMAFAIALGRWLLARDAGSAELRRLGGAVARAARSFMSRQYRLVAVAVGAPMLGALVLHTLRAGGSGLQAAFWSILGQMAGAGLACAAAALGAGVALGASVRSVVAARVSLDRALSISVRGGGVVGLLVESLSVLGACGLFGVIYAVQGGLAASDARAGEVAVQVAMLLPSLAVGAVTAALVLQRAGGTYHAAGDVGADLAGERDAGLSHDDARNPAVVADLVGDHVGLSATRAVDLFVSATLTNVAAVVIAAAVYQASDEPAAGATAFVLLPVVVRAFGIIASGFGIMVVRVEEGQNPSHALWRGHATTTVIALGGVAGATLWLMGDPHWPALCAAGTLGLIAAAAAAHAARYRIDRRFPPLRDLLEALRVGDAPAMAQGLATGLGAVVLPVVVVGAAFAWAWQLGSGTGLEHGGLLASLTALMAMLAVAPYVLAIGSLGPISDNARGVVAMASASSADDTWRRTGRLDDAGFAAATVSQTYLVLAGTLAALAAAFTPGLISRVDGSASLAHPVVAFCGALGGAIVLAYAGSAAKSALKGARAVALEVERQLRGFPRERGVAQVPRDYTPSYRSCIDLTAKSALHRTLPTAILAIFVPAGLAVLLYLLYRSSDPRLVAQGLTSFVVVASMTGLGAALTLDGARAVLSTARRLNRPGSNSTGFAAAASGDAVADVMGNAAAPAAHLLAKAVAVTVLALAPFLNS